MKEHQIYRLLNVAEFFVGLPGFEPRQTEPKSVVLPLHNRPILNRAAKIDSGVKCSKNIYMITNCLTGKFLVFVLNSYFGT
jgi:hypothetical protein